MTLPMSIRVAHRSARIGFVFARRRLRVYEVGISYSGRTYEEGKKIGWRDGVRAIWCIIRYSRGST